MAAITKKEEHPLSGLLREVVDRRVSRSELFTLGFHKLIGRLEEERSEHFKKADAARKVLKNITKAEMVALLNDSSFEPSRWGGFEVGEGEEGHVSVRVNGTVSMKALKYLSPAWRRAKEEEVSEREKGYAKGSLIEQLKRSRQEMKISMLEATLKSSPEGTKLLANLDEVLKSFAQAQRG